MYWREFLPPLGCGAQAEQCRVLAVMPSRASRWNAPYSFERSAFELEVALDTPVPYGTTWYLVRVESLTVGILECVVASGMPRRVPDWCPD